MANFFDYKSVTKKYKSKFKIITALSVFYDLQDPNKFLSGIENFSNKVYWYRLYTKLHFWNNILLCGNFFNHTAC